MAYDITFYFDSQGTPPKEIVEALVGGPAESGGTLTATNVAEGAGWVAADLRSAASDALTGRARIEVHHEPSLVGQMVGEVAVDDRSGRLRACDAFATLTLSGEVNWSDVRRVWSMLEDRWNAVPYDDYSGFAITRDSLN